MSQQFRDVIDLTEVPDSPPQPLRIRPSASNRASRPPRFSRNIIDVDNNDAYGGDDSPALVELDNTSPEIQELSPTTLQPVPLRHHQPPPPTQPATRNSHGLGRFLPALGNSHWPISSHTQSNIATDRPPPFLPSTNTGWMRNFISGRNVDQEHAREVLDAEENMQRRQQQERMLDYHRSRHAEMAVTLRNHPPGHMLVLPGNLDFGAAAFTMGSDTPTRNYMPTYEAPPPANRGYTRSAKEDDTIVCPNCDDELGTGDDETKRQVWVVKSCGHVSLCPLLIDSANAALAGLLRGMYQESNKIQKQVRPKLVDQTVLEMHC